MAVGRSNLKYKPRMPTLLRKAIGLRLRAARIAAELTQQDVATHFSCSRQAVSAWEGGRAMPDLAELIQLASLYAVTTDSLLVGVSDSEEEGRSLLTRLGKPGAPPALEERADPTLA
jgi:transcriptional regulator with XRE-family HTH domain